MVPLFKAVIFTLAVACLPLFHLNICMSDEYEIKFPADWEHAQVSVYKSPTLSKLVPESVDFAWSGKAIGSARGIVSVPTDSFVGVEIVGVEGYEDFLAGMPAEGVQRLDLKKLKLTNDTIRQLERITSLRQINLNGCSVDEIDLDQITGLPNLQSLHSNVREESAELHRVLVALASKSPKLQFFYDGTAMKLDEIRRFRGHDAPLAFKVIFDAEAVETMEALAEIPGLSGLNMDVSATAAKHFYRSLPKLKRLVWINWNDGKLDLDLLDSLTQSKTIKRLHVQGAFELSDAFVESLPQWKTVTSISFNSPLPEYQRIILPDMLLRMPKVSKLPKLSNISAEHIELLLQRESITHLKIAGLGDGATSAHVARVIEKQHSDLQWIQLRGVPLTQELGKAICKCTQLDHLDLRVDDFDGRFLEAVDQLRALDSMFLGVDGNAIDISVLGRFPNLASLQISLNAFDKTQWSFIAEAKTLRTLDVLGGYCDDKVVPWLKSNKSLRSFSTQQCAILTDAGVRELSTCDHLESLSLEGFISEDSVMRLRRLPKLRWLIVCSDLIDGAAKKRLKAEFEDLEHLSLREFNPASGKVVMGKDEIYRQIGGDGRKKLDAIEGKTLEEMLGPAMTAELKEEMRGQVVLVEFWGTWCGPCLNFIPELERLQRKYASRGFKVLAVHSKAEADTAEAYLKDHPKPWPNLIDSEGALQERFAVPSFPATYIFGIDGKLKVAVPMRGNLDPAIEKYLAVPVS